MKLVEPPQVVRPDWLLHGGRMTSLPGSAPLDLYYGCIVKGWYRYVHDTELHVLDLYRVVRTERVRHVHLNQLTAREREDLGLGSLRQAMGLLGTNDHEERITIIRWTDA